jgi:hypothetical protein
MRAPLARNDVEAHFRDLAACFRASFTRNVRPQKSEGAGNTGRSMRPQPRVQNKKAHEHSHHGHTGSPGIPRAMVYGLFRALPGDRAFLPPSPAGKSRRLDASVGASGPHGFAVRVRHVRPRAISVHRIPPRVDDVAQRPSMGRDGNRYRFDLGQRRRGIFFRRGLDTPQSEKQPDLPVGQISKAAGWVSLRSTRATSFQHLWMLEGPRGELC